MTKNVSIIHKTVAKRIASGWPDNVAKIIVRAWSDPGYKKRLLTVPGHHGESEEQARERTRAALAEEGINIAEASLVVLNEQEFESYTAKEGEDVLALPEPIGAGRSLKEAKEALVLHCWGV